MAGTGGKGSRRGAGQGASVTADRTGPSPDYYITLNNLDTAGGLSVRNYAKLEDLKWLKRYLVNWLFFKSMAGSRLLDSKGQTIC